MSTAARKKAEQSGNLDGFLAKKYRAHGFHIETASRESALRGAANIRWRKGGKDGVPTM